MPFMMKNAISSALRSPKEDNHVHVCRAGVTHQCRYKSSSPYVKGCSRSPSLDFDGLFTKRTEEYMRRTNGYLEESAVKLVNLQADHRFLEIGFGPGIGLAAALEIIKLGKGKVYGVDLSTYVIKRADKQFEKELASGKLETHQSNVIYLPFMDAKFDRVIHCNCFYYWANVQTAIKEIYRVMAPGGVMVTTLSLQDLRIKRAKGWLLNINLDLILYMTALEKCGFIDVHIEYLKHGVNNYQAIYSTKQLS